MGDRGDLYNFYPMDDFENPITSKDADIELVYDEEYGAKFKITHKMQIPLEAGDGMERAVTLLKRADGKPGARSEKTEVLTVEKYISLSTDSKALKVRCVTDNNSKDHKTRIVLPTGLNATTHKAESVFECVKRPNRQKKSWQNPSESDRTLGFVTMMEGNDGIGVSNIGIYEYEILKNNEIALTLIRATREIADWGHFPTEYSQCIGKTELEFEIVPFCNEEKALEALTSFHYPLSSVQIWERDEGGFDGGVLTYTGNMVRLTGLKKEEKGEGTVVRFVSYSEENETITIDKKPWMNTMCKSNVIEEKGEAIEVQKDKYQIEIKPHEILTVIIN